jgi:3-deoxy-D-manno-octulosonic acid kinase
MAGSKDLVFIHPRYSEIPESLKDILFEPDRLKEAGLITKELTGRGATYFFQLQEQGCVLRHYWRGGLIRNLSADQYIWLGLGQSRSYREWQLLEKIEAFGLPAPRPVALRIQRQGILYRSDIVTEEIKAVRSLAEILKVRPATVEEWNKVGQTIRTFHAHNIFHQDLNANNILLGTDSCHLIDFDRGRIQPGNWWHGRVLNRLKRSLEKLGSKCDPFYFDPSAWTSLEEAYGKDG